MSDYIILPEHQLKHLTSEGRRQLFLWIHDEGVHYSQFHTADGSIHLEVDGYGFKRFDCSETFADVQRFIKILQHATANQLSWCDAEKTFQGNRHGKQKAIQDMVKQIEEVTKDPQVVASLADELIVVCKQRDEALQQLQNVVRDKSEISKVQFERIGYLESARIEALRERDELHAQLERAEAKTSAEYEAHRMTKCERDALKAEVERLKAACEKEFESVQQLNDKVERLKADNEELHNTLASLK